VENIPIVNWNWAEISKILSGETHSLEYKAPDVTKIKSPIIQLDFSTISEELTAYLLNNPDAMQNISPRKFEELVANIMEKYGYEVTLTQQSRDGGIDIFALKNDGFGNILTIVDCKKYSTTNPVGIAAVRGMYGTLQIESASHGIIATTSRFTRDAYNLAQEYKYQLSLKDHADILKWIQNTKI
jgi:restriction endonuclease Mrr